MLATEKLRASVTAPMAASTPMALACLATGRSKWLLLVSYDDAWKAERPAPAADFDAI